jgi:hypothetical protein
MKPLERPQPTPRGPTPIRGRLWYRLVLVSVLASALVVLGLVVTRGGNAPAEADPPDPGVQPAVQKWFKDREGEQVELNNALVPFALKQLTTAAAAKAPCERLRKVSHAMVVRGRAPQAEVDLLARAGLVKFEQGSQACLAGDMTAAKRLVGDGLAERAAAAEPLDETLDGD